MYELRVRIICMIILAGFLFGCGQPATPNVKEDDTENIIIYEPEFNEAPASPTPKQSTVTTKRGGVITVQRVDGILKSITFSASQEELGILSELRQSNPDITNGELESTYFPELYALKLEQMDENDEIWSVPAFGKARANYINMRKQENVS